tara:strand:+ start:178 stop:351 length:174 start_codon:yes stop_codon:yes gene_type:complete
MINTVEKKYNEDSTFNYEVNYQDGTAWTVPHDTANRHYQEILEWVSEGNTITDKGGS